MGIQGSSEGHVEATPAAVLAAITDPAGLPRWNRRIVRVVEQPAVLEPRAEWAVQMRIYGQKFLSRSRVLQLDPRAGRFQYRSSPDGDPDFAVWTWDVSPEGTGARVRVLWDLNPKLFMNRMFWVRLRVRGLPKEVRESLTALDRYLGEGRRAAATPALSA